MKIQVDENIPNISVKALRTLSHDIRDIRGTDKQGLFDDDFWALAQREQRLVISTDKGFVQYRDEDHFGILVIRLRQPNEARIHSRIMSAMNEFSPADWPGLLGVIR